MNRLNARAVATLRRPGRHADGGGLYLAISQDGMRVHRVTVHGFRSSFRDWAGDATRFPRELAEAALAHVAGDETERAYRRGDALERRREMMNAWTTFCGSGSGENVVRLRVME